MTTNKQWYAVYTRPKWEKKVAGLLAKKNIEVYCPTARTKKQWSDRTKFVEEPLFKSYVFVRVQPEEQTRVKQTDGIINFIFWLNKPAVIRDAEIDAIKDFLTAHPKASFREFGFKVNDAVKVTNDAVEFGEGKVVEVRKNYVKVLLPSLGYVMVADNDCLQLTAIEPYARQMRTVA